MTQLLHERAPDETRGSRDQDSHRGRVYCRAFALLATLLLAGCHSTKHATHSTPPSTHLSFMALDAMQQRLVSDYEPVSRALTAYELARRDWRDGRLSTAAFAARGRAYRPVVTTALGKLQGAPASGETARAKRILVAGLQARATALAASPRSARYLAAWNRSVVDARRALTILQDIRDRDRLIPLPEDSVS